MEFGEGFWGPIIATGGILLGAFIAWLTLAISRKYTPPSPGKEKNMTYGCGEDVDPNTTQADAREFFSPIKRTFGKFYNYILPGQSGDLSTYLLWIVAGIVLIFAWIAVEMG
jgi:hypothetical protein